MLFGGGFVAPGQSVPINIGGRNAEDLWCDQVLRKLDEDPVVDAFLGLPPGPMIFGHEFGFAGERLWCLVRAPRQALVPSDPGPGRKPGDFDVIVGRIVDEVIDLSVLGLVECKVGRAITKDDSPDVRYNGWGTEQASDAALLGFDYVLLAHFLVRDPAPGPGLTWSAAADAANFRPEIDRMHGRAVAQGMHRQPAIRCVVPWLGTRGDT